MVAAKIRGICGDIDCEGDGNLHGYTLNSIRKMCVDINVAPSGIVYTYRWPACAVNRQNFIEDQLSPFASRVNIQSIAISQSPQDIKRVREIARSNLRMEYQPPGVDTKLGIFPDSEDEDRIAVRRVKIINEK